MQKQWRIHPHDPGRILALERACNIPTVVAQLLVCRGIRDAALVHEFLDARLSSLRDPELLPGIPAAAEQVMSAVSASRRICIYGDYDVDGMSGTAILVSCLRLLGADASYYVPHRIEEGYGLNAEALRTLAARGVQLVITVDCGIASLAEAELARELGLELVVTDHHQFAAAGLPKATLVHPALHKRDPSVAAYPFEGLCGAGVAFKLAWALCQRASQAKKVGPRMREFLMQAVGLAALGTVADVVPLVDENRVLVRHGLVSLAERPTLGIAALAKLTGLDGKRAWSSEDIGFTIAPRLNAAGRLNQATLGIELLTTESSERAAALAAYLHELNGSRESLERSIYLAALKQAQEHFDPEGDAALVLADRGWHPGVIGIVAARLAEKFHRPVVLLALDELGVKPATGSARSVPGFDVHAGFTACGEHLVSFGGHAAAAGLKLQESQLALFREQFCEYAASRRNCWSEVPELAVDAEVSFSSLGVGAVSQLERLAPFGPHNPRPTLCASEVRLSEPPKRIGGGERHLSLRLVQHGIELRGVAFGGGDWAGPLAEHTGPLAVAFRPQINEFRGRRTVELLVCDWQPARAGQAEMCA